MCNKTKEVWMKLLFPLCGLEASAATCSDVPRRGSVHATCFNDAQCVGTSLHPSHRRCVITTSLATVMTTTFQHCIQTESGCRWEARTDTRVSSPPSSPNLYDTDGGIFTNPGELEVITRYLLMNYENDTKMSQWPQIICRSSVF